MPNTLDSYILLPIPPPSGSAAQSVEQILQTFQKSKTFDHVKNVAEKSRRLARQFHLDETCCETAGYLHDAGVILPPASMLLYAETYFPSLDEAERRYPFLLHQKISAIMARELFKIDDARILSAVACHTTLKSRPSPYDMVLFLADKLAWDQEGIPPFAEPVNNALSHSLEKACYVYFRYVWTEGKILYPHQWFLEAKQWLWDSFPCRSNPSA